MKQTALGNISNNVSYEYTMIISLLSSKPRKCDEIYKIMNKLSSQIESLVMDAHIP